MNVSGSPTSPLRDDAAAIWWAGVHAVAADRLVRQTVQADVQKLQIADQAFAWDDFRSLLVVGAGKAGAGMARGVEQAVGTYLPPNRRHGWVNVPADCVTPTSWIHLHAARPPGINLPTAAAEQGTREILRRLAAAAADDLVLVLLSGGGSALLTAPAKGLSIVDKQQVASQLAAHGASIQEINTVRKQLSAVKGGRLLTQCSARRAIVLVISDVIGDPLDLIASGPAMPDRSTPADALEILQRRLPQRTLLSEAVWRFLESAADVGGVNLPVSAVPSGGESRPTHAPPHIVIGHNATACAAAARTAEARGYRVELFEVDQPGDAAATGRRLLQVAQECRSLLHGGAPPVCLISGGETTVQLAATSQPRRGGRNQELALAALDAAGPGELEGICLLSGGTDGEDGPTDAAGGFADQAAFDQLTRLRVPMAAALAINDSYTCLQQGSALFRTGPTHTNVMDIRVVLVTPPAV